MLPDISVSAYKAKHGSTDVNAKAAKRRSPEREDWGSPARRAKELRLLEAEYLRLGKAVMAEKVKAAVDRLGVVAPVPVKRKASRVAEVFVIHVGANRYSVIEGVIINGKALKSRVKAAEFVAQYQATGA